MSGLRYGSRARCQRCGGRIVLVKRQGGVSIGVGVWVHVSAVRRLAATHWAVGPSS